MDSKRSIRAKFAASLSLGLAFVAHATWANNAEAQLRTGRQSSREFYADDQDSALSAESTDSSSSEKRTASRITRKTREQSVVQASHSESTSSNSPTSRTRPASSNASSNRTTSESVSSRPAVRVTPKAVVRTAEHRHNADASHVVQASCPNCEKGIDHTHAAIHKNDGDVIVDEGTQGVVAENCDTCAPDCGFECDPGINIRLALPFANHLQRISARVEAATFWPTGQNIPALVRTGEIGANGSADLFGGTTTLDSAAMGLRGEFGMFFRRDETTGVMFRFFDSGAQSLTYNSTLANATTVVRPYFDPVSNQQQSISINEAGISQGGVLAHATSDVYGGDVLLRQMMSRSYLGRTELLVGYQTARLSDSIIVDSVTNATNELQLHDRFTTNNRFNGGVIGLSGITYAQNWSLSGMFKMGFGNMDRSVVIDGSQIITVPGPPQSVSVSNNGLLARSTNNGVYNFNTFVMTPELNVTLGYRLTRNLEATVGYSYLNLPKVARAGNQIDPNLAANLSDPLAGAPRPSFSLLESNYNLHSVNYGLQYRY